MSGVTSVVDLSCDVSRPFRVYYYQENMPCGHSALHITVVVSGANSVFTRDEANVKASSALAGLQL